MKIGMRVKIVQGDEYSQRFYYWLGRTGTVLDTSDGMFCWGVKFDTGEHVYFATKELQPEVKIL